MISTQCTFPMTERVINLVTYIQWENPQVIEYDKICNGLKALSEILSIYSYIIKVVKLSSPCGRAVKVAVS